MIERKAGENEVETALSSLTRMLEQHYGRPAILLIDEYDVPLAAASQNGYYREMMDVMRSVMSVKKSCMVKKG